MSNPLDPQLLEILVCPSCRGELVYRPEQDALDCLACGVRYPVRDGIPILLVDEALPLEGSESSRD